MGFPGGDMSEVVSDSSITELLRQARRLGLSWGLRPGTGTSDGRVITDGDSQTINVVPLALQPFEGLRVMVMFVPGGGNYVIGALTDPKPLFRAMRSTAQSIPTGAETEIQWTNVDVDTHNGWNASSPTDYTVPFSGWYQLSGGCGWVSGGTGTGRRGAFFRIGGVSAEGAGVFMANVGSTGTHCIAARTSVLYAGAGDTFQMSVYQEQGSPLNTATGSQGPSIAIEFLRPLRPGDNTPSHT